MTNETLIAENVEVPIETLHKATKQGASLSRWAVIEAVIKGLDPESKKIFNDYQEEQNPCK